MWKKIVAEVSKVLVQVGIRLSRSVYVIRRWEGVGHVVHRGGVRFLQLWTTRISPCQ